MVNCCIETKSTKSCCIETKRPKLSPAAGDLFDGLQSNLIDHMVSREPKKNSMVSKMQKKCAWSEMYQNDGLPWIYPGMSTFTAQRADALS